MVVGHLPSWSESFWQTTSSRTLGDFADGKVVLREVPRDWSARKVIPTTPRASSKDCGENPGTDFRAQGGKSLRLHRGMGNLRPRFGVLGSNPGVNFTDDYEGLKPTHEIWNMRRRMSGTRMCIVAARAVARWYIVPRTQLHGCFTLTPATHHGRRITSNDWSGGHSPTADDRQEGH